MADLEEAVRWAVGIAADDSHGYDQPGREGRDFDCSSLVCRALKAAGFPMPTPSFSTRSMGAWLEAHGWSWHVGVAGVQRGDILWKPGHTAMAESASRMVEAQMNERRGISGGRVGDQTGWEIVSNQPLGKYQWTGYWRYEEDIVTEDDINKIADRVWNYMQNGTRVRDRVQGTDEAANACRSQLTRTDDPTGRGTVADMYTRICFVGQKLDKLSEDVAALKAALEAAK